MPQFNINKLVVLHLYNYIKPKGEQDPLLNVERNCNAVKVSTCMRIILIIHSDSLISNEQLAAYSSLTDFLNKKNMYSANTFFERLDGTKAYEFLLYWMLGGINPKRTFDDTRILGDVRAIWNTIQRSTSLRSKGIVPIYTTFFQSLFADSVQLGRLIEIYTQNDVSELEVKLKRASSNCAWSRINNFLGFLSGFDYQHFAENTHLNQFEASLLTMKEKILSKVELSTIDNKVCFFKSKYEVSEEQIEGISKRIEKINKLLEVLNSLKIDAIKLSEPENKAAIENELSDLSKENKASMH